MTTPSYRTIKRAVSPEFLGATRYTYSNYLSASTDVIAAEFFDQPGFSFAPRDLMWCNLSDGYFTLRFTSTTTAEIATD